MEAIYDKINDYGSVKIRLASPEDIRSWSYGEVKKPETINYRTYRPEKDGLFCERIFGPERDWECFCGKYKGIKHKGIVCDRCGVKITTNRVRRKRMGHINLAAPVCHIWFFKAMPSRLGNLLAMKTSAMERVIYFQDYVVIDPGDTPLEPQQLLNEDEYQACREKYGDDFMAGMGAEAVRELLKRLDLVKISEDLRAELKETGSKQRTKEIIKRLKVVEALRDSENLPEWMVLEVIPVIPPDLRPLVMLESGNFATSDLNDLYRRLINRNNRLKKLLDLNAPEVIIRNEKRMLQQSVDALFDNNRCRRPVLGSSNRPLKSLTDMIKGKQGRFRENLLGKRVDYSARSVIVVGPELKLHQCGLPKKIALELYQPFIIRRLKELNRADTIKAAKKKLEAQDEEVWDILDEVIDEHPVLLNRAPTLHRMGIQAFEPVLVEGNAIRLHPLVCAGFNADFDGDQMAVHLPLSVEAQIEAATLLLSTNNIFSPSNGNPVIAPSQDIVLGLAYLTTELSGRRGEDMVFDSREEAFMAWGSKKVQLHAKVSVRMPEGKVIRDAKGNEVTGPCRVDTTLGRVVFNDILPEGMPFYNLPLDKRGINSIISECHELCGKQPTLDLLDEIKELGFKAGTMAGLSLAKDDLRIPDEKWEIIQETRENVERIQKNFTDGVITDEERYNAIVDRWTHATDHISRVMMNQLKTDRRDGEPYLNPVFLMADSGARGSTQQIRQLAGMRGLMAKPSGRIIETPIEANFREGLRVLEYFSSTHGARKGLADTALKTADSGYLTRKLADVSQNVVINEVDCGTINGISKSAVRSGEDVEVSLAQGIYGRTIAETIEDKTTGETVAKEGDLLTLEQADKIDRMGFDKVRVRSPLTCETPLGLCARCYGMDLSRGRLVEDGLAVGIIAAQSIGEPGTQLTMRTFHIGGIGVRRVEQSEHVAGAIGTVHYEDLKLVENDGRSIVLNHQGSLVIRDEDTEEEIERHGVPLGSTIEVEEGERVRKGQRLCQWDPHMQPILSDAAGVVEFEGIIEGQTMKLEEDPHSKRERRVIIEHKGDLHPTIYLKTSDGDIIEQKPIPEKAHLEVEDGDEVVAGTILAKTPREISGSQDITGGLPRVTELFEVRQPKDKAEIAKIDGVIEYGDKKRGKQVVLVRDVETGDEEEHLIPRGKQILLKKGDVVQAGDRLTAGSVVPQELLNVKGTEVLQAYLLEQIQQVYRSQSVNINDKHIEVVLSQMMRKVRVDDPGDSEFLPRTDIDRFLLRQENERLMEEGKRPATFHPLLLGITKASLQSESFISAASFQETTKVLTQAALAGKQDSLLGLKENVILGHMIPAGTGFKSWHAGVVEHEEPDVPDLMEDITRMEEGAA